MNKLEENIKNIVYDFLNDHIDIYSEDHYEIDEINTTAAIDGYNTPHAFSKPNNRNKKFKVLMRGKSLDGYKVVNEEIDNKDIKLIKLVIRDEVADILKTIWLKRSAWK